MYFRNVTLRMSDRDLERLKMAWGVIHAESGTQNRPPEDTALEVQAESAVVLWADDNLRPLRMALAEFFQDLRRISGVC